MNQNRFWPGVPNRYSATSGLIVMRPKSRATVVVSLDSRPSTSSTPTPASVSSSSVCSGGISLTELTIVVLPVPKPPAMTIFTGVGTSSSPPGRSDSTDTVQHRLQQVPVRHLRDSGGVSDHDVTALDEVAQQHLDDHQRHVEVGGDLRDGQRAP